MLHLEEQQNTLGLACTHSDAGKDRGRLKPYAHPPAGNVDTTSHPIRAQDLLELLPSAMPELVAMPRSQISIDRLQDLLNSTHQQRLWQRLGEVSTSKGRSLLPYWSESVKGMSDTLLLPIKTDSPASALTSYSGTANRTGASSWFSMRESSAQRERWLKISSPSSTVLAADSMDSESIRLRSRKIRIYPEPALEVVWKKWVAATRYCYNQAIAQQRAAAKRLSKLNLRNVVMNLDLPNWVKETPCHIRQNAIFDAHQAFCASRDAKFRSIRNQAQTIKFNSSNFSKGTWYSKLTKNLTWKASEPVPIVSEYGTQIVKHKDRWYAIFPEVVTHAPCATELADHLQSSNSSGGIIALDPGVRTFLTGFDGHRFTQFGDGDFGRVSRFCHHLDKLQSRISKAKCKLKRKLRMASFRLRQKIRNLVDELHKQVACYLTHNYTVIFLPTFKTSDMVAKVGRKIGSKTARAMLTWAHYRFKQTLKHQAELRSCEVVEVSEAYTSKTCTSCGQVHTKLGGSKVFKCPNCGHCLSRDFNGALGIMLRALRDTSTTLSSAIVGSLSSNAQ